MKKHVEGSSTAVVDIATVCRGINVIHSVTSSQWFSFWHEVTVLMAVFKITAVPLVY